MSYKRVIPRDLFNEGDLLKCLGRLWIELDRRGYGTTLAREDADDGAPFEVCQDEASGAIFVLGLLLDVRGEAWSLTRPLNARSAFPLYAENDDREVPVFTDQGALSDEFLHLIGGA